LLILTTNSLLHFLDNLHKHPISVTICYKDTKKEGGKPPQTKRIDIINTKNPNKSRNKDPYALDDEQVMMMLMTMIGSRA